MKNLFIWIGVALIVAATIVSQFTGIAVSAWIELAGFAVGLASCILGLFTKAEKKDWKFYVSVSGVVIGSAFLVFGGFAEGTITTLISLVAGAVAMIIGLLPVFLSKKE